jgi:hypothetical protein
MTNATDRATIVDALKTVPELSVTPTTPDTVVPMAAWPAWSSTKWRNWCVTTSEWFVFVIAPNGTNETTVDAGDDIQEAVAAALWSIAKVTNSEPWRIPLEAGQQTVPVVRFTLEI